MAVRVVVNGVSMAAFLGTDPTMQAALRLAAQGVQEKAIQHAPVGKSIKFGPITRKGKKIYSHRHGLYKKRLQVRAYRSAWRVESTDPFGPMIEWGTVRSPAYAPLRKAALASGLRFKPNGASRGGSE